MRMGPSRIKLILWDVVYGSESRPIILVTHDEATFSANDGIRRAWMDMNGEATYLRPKTKGQGIMVSEFLLPFGRLNLSSLTAEQKTRIMEPTASGLTVDEAVEILEYGKNREGYWDGAKLLEQVVNKALPIAEALFPGYSLFFLFDNATSHSVYAEDALRTTKMNKGSGGKQPWLRPGVDGVRYEQPMAYLDERGVWQQKGIQRVLEERGLWPDGGLNLECPKPKCDNCQIMAACRSCVKKQTCDSCKEPIQHSSLECSKARRCDACTARARRCTCIPRTSCDICAMKKGKCGDCEVLPPRCTSSGKYFTGFNIQNSDFGIDCCAKRLLSIQDDFSKQKCAIEEAIKNSPNGRHHKVMYYPKYHCELNHIEHYWCNCKHHARFECEYSLDGLRKQVPLALASVSNHTILANYHRCQRKIQLYREGIVYGSPEWKARTTHHKPYTPGEDR